MTASGNTVDFAALLREQRHPGGPKCRMCNVLVNLSDDNREQVERAMQTSEASAVIARAVVVMVERLQEKGYDVDWFGGIEADNVTRHRRNGCAGARRV